jgi:hypothetical protein
MHPRFYPLATVLLASIIFVFAVVSAQTTEGGTTGNTSDSNLTPPPGAAAAGFTTLAANYDFTQRLPSGWLGCQPWDGHAHQWYQDAGGGVPCDIHQVTDPKYGGTVLDLRWKPSYLGKGFPFTFQQIYTHSPDGTLATDFPNAYYEATFRTETTPDVSGRFEELPAGVISWWSWPHVLSGQQIGWELDFIDSYFKYNGCFSTGVVGYNGSGGAGLYAPAPCPNYHPKKYHTWAMRMTGDGVTNAAFCEYLDGNMVGSCTTIPYANQNAIQRHTLILWEGISCKGGSDASCTNQPITNVYNCSGKICMHFARTINYQACNIVNVSGVNGVRDANGVHTSCSKSGSGSDTDWILTDSRWPLGGSYTGGGTLNPYARLDTYVKSVRVWSCADWKNFMCNGRVLTNTKS